MKAFLRSLLFVGLFGLFPSFAQDINLPDLQARVAKGDPEAELELGRAYHLGKGVPKDFAKAADLYGKAAAQGNAKAMYNLGYIFHHAQGVTQDDVAAAQWFQKSADAGLPAGQLQVGLAYFHGDGGQKQDYPAALKWLKLTAQHTESPKECGMAASTVGTIYENGYGVPLDVDKAMEWYTQAANLGDNKAMANLGRLEADSSGADKDLVHGYMWMKLGAYRGNAVAMQMLRQDLVAHKFSPEQIVEGDALVADYQAKHPRMSDGSLAPVIPNTRVSTATNAPAATSPAGATNH